MPLAKVRSGGRPRLPASLPRRRPLQKRIRPELPLSRRRLPRRPRTDTADSELEVESSGDFPRVPDDPPETDLPLVQSSGSRKLIKRATFGLLLGMSGVVVVFSGGLLFSAIVAACAYQVSREFNGLVISMRNERKTFAPPNSIRELMSVFCLLFPLTNYFYPRGGKSALLLSVAVFILLCMEVLFVKTPKFSQLTAAVFGLFYCGRGIGSRLLRGESNVRSCRVPAFVLGEAEDDGSAGSELSFRIELAGGVSYRED